MTLTLSTTDLTRLEEALRALLSPMDHADTTEWRRQVTRKVRALMGTDSVTSIMRDTGAPLLVADGEYEARALKDYADHYYRQVVGDNLRIECGMTVWTREQIWPWEAISRSEYFHDFCVPNAIQDSAGAAVRVSETDEALLYIHTAEAHRFQPDGREMAILRLLRPALEAGARAAMSLGAVRTDWRMFDAAPMASGVFDRHGKLVHANPAFANLIGDRVLGPPVSRAAELMVRNAITGGMFRPGAGDCSPSMTVRTASGSYRLNLTWVEQSPLGQTGCYIVIVTPPPGAPNPAALMTRFRLTAREAQVALLMARGDRNRVIASALGTSVHTVRRQAERVLSKLGVSTRAAIAGRIT
jgi:DNA-binding CsgD family transcriptional regulator